VNDDVERQRERLERQASLAFLTGAVAMAIVCGAIIVARWFAGVLEDHAERVFWTGAVLAFVMVAVLAGAAWPGGDDDRRVVRRTRLLLRIGLILFVFAPGLCIGALIADFYG
jgi:hypothetical protein